MWRRPLILIVSATAALALVLHGPAVVACESMATESAHTEIADDIGAACAACVEPDPCPAGSDPCSAACLSVTDCVHTGHATRYGEASPHSPAMVFRAGRSAAVDPPPPRTDLLV